MAPKKPTKGKTAVIVATPEPEELQLDPNPPPPIQWTAVPCGESQPASKRTNQTGCVVDRKLFFVAGWSGRNIAEVQMYSLDDNTWSYKPFPCGFSGISQHVSVVIDRLIYTFFGWSEGKRNMDVFAFDTESLKWGQTAGLQSPVGACFAAACITDKQVYFFGGTDNTECKATLIALERDSLEWTTCANTGALPARPRSSCSLTHIDGKLYVFGGRDQGEQNSGGPLGCTNDTFVYDIDSKEWIMQRFAGQPPARRCGHAATAVRDRIYIFGGQDSNERYLDDLWVLTTTPSKFSGGNPFWLQVHVEGACPVARTRASLLAVDTHLYLFGGHSADGPIDDFQTTELILDVPPPEEPEEEKEEEEEETDGGTRPSSGSVA